MANEWYRVNVNTENPTQKRRPSATGILVGTRLQPGLLEAVDHWRKMQLDLPTRPEAVRRLVQLALHTEALQGTPLASICIARSSCDGDGE
jgi:hypothetical protein